LRFERPSSVSFTLTEASWLVTWHQSDYPLPTYTGRRKSESTCYVSTCLANRQTISPALKLLLAEEKLDPNAPLIAVMIVEGCMQAPDGAGVNGTGVNQDLGVTMTRIAIPSNNDLKISVDQVGKDTVVRLSGRVDVDSSPDLRDRLRTLFSEEALPKTIIVDLTGVSYIETSGVATLIETLRIARHHEITFRLQGLSGAVLRLFEVTGVLALFEESNSGQKVILMANVLESVGERTIEHLDYVGSLNIQWWATLRAMRQALPFVGNRYRWRTTVRQMLEIGVDAMPMVSLMSICTGFILAMQGASELRRFGALHYVIELVAVGFTRELGPLLTAIAVSGRSGSAFAAEIGTMKVTEELDSLRVMALEPVEFVLAPKYLAALISVPCLSIIANLFGILAGGLFMFFSTRLSPSALHPLCFHDH
jgi:anti-anti-sigma factor